MENISKKIILVDDNIVNLSIGKQILKERYSVYPATSAARMFDLLEKIEPDLILLDIEMPEMNGYEALKKLKDDPSTTDIPVIFLTAKNDPGSEVEGLSLGAVDYISKPFSPPLLLKRIENHLTMENQKRILEEYNSHLQEAVEEKTEEVVELQNAILCTVAELVEERDSVTGGHINRTQQYLTLMVTKMMAERIYWDEISKWNLSLLIPSAQLHDVGKIAISDVILNKPGRLTPEEYDLMKQHTIFGEHAIDAIMKQTTEKDFLTHARIFAGAHHEKWDGTGYHRGLKGKNIPLQGRIMAIADVYDALIARRPYKEPMSPSDARTVILKGKETHFDPLLVEVFDDMYEDFTEIADYCNNLAMAG
jgi:putative two-component system response regulator